MTLGPFVACNSFREPALLAKMADTLDEVSGGRVLLGLGAGWHEPEYTAFGFPFDHLASRFEEALQIIVPLLKGERVTFHGTTTRSTTACCARAARARSARRSGSARSGRGCCAWSPATPTPTTPSGIAIQRPRSRRSPPGCGLPRGRARPGHDPATSGTHVLVPDAGDAPDGPPDAMTGSAQEIAERCGAFKTEGGVSHMTVILDPWTTHGIEQFGKRDRGATRLRVGRSSVDRSQ